MKIVWRLYAHQYGSSQKAPPPAGWPSSSPREATHQPPKNRFGEETEEDRIKALADAEKKNLWDATEVIDMDTF